MDQRANLEPSTSELVRKMLESSRDLLKAELRLATSELGSDVTAAFLGLLTLAVAFVQALLGLTLFAVVITLAAGGSAVVACAVAACMCLAIALGASYAGYRLLPRNLLSRTGARLESDLEYVEHRIP